jgi:hypothetical protein
MVLLTALSIHTLSATGSELETDVYEITAWPSLHKVVTELYVEVELKQNSSLA